jgi:RNA polymerase sigma-70 factor (ECF subfamily)
LASAGDWERQIAAVYASDRRRVLASLIRLLGDFNLAEEALHDAFAAAVEQWPQRGLPESPWRWLVSAGRFRTIDRIRRQQRARAAEPELLLRLEAEMADHQHDEPDLLTDDSLRLIFTCCHPALPPDAQIALTLREVCGLTTERIAQAYLVGAPTMAQRIVRAKARIRDAALPYEVPDRADLPRRLETVLRVIYLVYTEGYSAIGSAEGALLAEEAIRLGRLLVELLLDPEALGLLALMLLLESRRATRTTASGDLVLLPDQDRSAWDRARIGEGLALIDRAYATGEIGGYVLQAAIAAEHARAADAQATNWTRIAELYDLLSVADPSPVVELNRAVAIAMRDGPAAALPVLDGLVTDRQLANYHLALAARADLLRQLGRHPEAIDDYRQALALAQRPADQRFLKRRLDELAAAHGVSSSAAISSTSDS